MLRRNHVFARLPRGIQQRLKPHLDFRVLDSQRILFDADEPVRTVYFPETAVISLMMRAAGGKALDVGPVGRDGLVGLTGFPGVDTMPCQAIVSIPGTAWTISADLLRRDALEDPALAAVCGGCAYAVLARSMRIGICSKFHTVEERCARWLLSARDVIDTGTVPMTQQQLATVLGLRRPSITEAIAALERQRLVAAERGCVTIVDRPGLTAAACECYHLARKEHRRLFRRPQS